MLLAFVMFANISFAYGPIGHRTIAKIAEYYLTDEAKQGIIELLDGEGIVLVSTYADDIKSDKNFDYTYTWHFVNAKDGVSYKDSDKNPEGDLIKAIQESISILKDNSSSKEEKAFRLKMLVHFIGDLHQPFHTGRAEDWGGNKIKVKWFRKSTNIHRVWDSDMINFNRFSYTELAEIMKKPPYINKDEIEKGNIISWYNESKILSNELYDSVQPDQNLSYEYNYKYFPVVKQQLNFAGIRLAKVLNEIFQ